MGLVAIRIESVSSAAGEAKHFNEVSPTCGSFSWRFLGRTLGPRPSLNQSEAETQFGAGYALSIGPKEWIPRGLSSKIFCCLSCSMVHWLARSQRPTLQAAPGMDQSHFPNLDALLGGVESFLRGATITLLTYYVIVEIFQNPKKLYLAGQLLRPNVACLKARMRLLSQSPWVSYGHVN